MKIKELVLKAVDLDALADFYFSIFKINTQIVNQRCVEMNFGHSILKFIKSDINYRYHFAFNIPPNSIDLFLDKLKDQISFIPFEGTEIIDFNKWNAKALYFYDPAGNIVELIDRRSLDSSEMGQATTQILSISEIGIAVNDIQKVFDRLKFTLEINQYKDKSDHFLAVGDEQGLIILVHDEVKQWFPTGHIARSVPMIIKVQVETEQYIIINDENLEIIPL